MSSPPQLHDALQRLTQLPPIQSIVTRVLQTSSDPDASALDLGRYITADQSLSALLLRLVNSSYYGFYREITSITNAIVILGFVEVRNLVLTATALRVFPNKTSRIDREQLWRHSLATAIAAEKAARLVKAPVQPSAFAAGLLHDMGKVALDVLYPDQFVLAVQRSLREHRPLHETELELFHANHQQIGAHLADRWNLPVNIIDAIRFHHQPVKSEVDPALSRLILVADFVAYTAGFGDAGNGSPPGMPAESLQLLDISTVQLDHLCEAVSESRASIDELMGVMKS